MFLCVVGIFLSYPRARILLRKSADDPASVQRIKRADLTTRIVLVVIGILALAVWP
jgi:hypothetical protein